MIAADGNIRGTESRLPSRERDVPGSQRGRSWASILVLGCILTAVLLVALGANSWKRTLPVGAVHVEGAALVPAREIIRLADVAPRTLLFEIDLAGVRQRVMRNPYIRSASVNRDGPEGITIEVEERRPVALLAADQLFYIDEEGYVLPVSVTGRLLDLPILTGALPLTDCVPGHRLTGSAVHEALDLLLLSRQVGEDLSRRISEVHIQPGGDLVLYTSDLAVPIFFGNGDLPMKLLKFNGFWQDVVPLRGAQQLQYVDVRFEDQVVVRWSGSAARQ